jgi:hypothetical protein
VEGLGASQFGDELCRKFGHLGLGDAHQAYKRNSINFVCLAGKCYSIFNYVSVQIILFSFSYFCFVSIFLLKSPNYVAPFSPLVPG